MPEELMLKQYDSITKAVEGERALNVVITTNDVDRCGDIVEPKGAKLINFKKNPVVLMAHDYKGLPIGRATDLAKTDNGITAKVIFPDEGIYPLADTVYTLYKNKFMKAWSIGFIPIKSEDIVADEDNDSKSLGRGKRFKTWELLELSACSVPANPNALGNMLSKGINIEPLKEAGFIEIEDGLIPLPEGEVVISAKLLAEADIDKFNKMAEGVAKEILEKELILKPEETDDSIRLPVKGEEGKHKGHKIRWITVSTKEGIRGIYCIDCKKIITYVFDKGKGWTMAKAKKWMEDHGKTIEDYFQKVDWDVDYDIEEVDWEMKMIDLIEKDEKEKEEIQLDVKEVFPNLEFDKSSDKFTIDGDEIIDRLYELTKENKELKEKNKELELKAGAVLNAKNKSNLKQAQELIQSVLDSASTEEEDSLEIDDEKDIEDDNTVIDLTTDTVDDPPIDEPGDEDKIEVDEKVIADCITKQMNYTLGKLDKSDT